MYLWVKKPRAAILIHELPKERLIMERVELIQAVGDSPVLLVAPHGADGDDDNTGEITRQMAEILGCWAVINNGFQRSEVLDYANDLADCNNISHVIGHKVVEGEFLRPILKAILEMEDVFYESHIFYIHGMSNQIRKIAKDEVDMIIGYGAAKNPSHSCTERNKNAFMYILDQLKLNAYQGKAGGKYSGAKATNMNQYFRKHEFDESINSMQIEIVKALREPGMIDLTSETLAHAIAEYTLFLDCDEQDQLPKNWRNDWFEIGEEMPEI